MHRSAPSSPPTTDPTGLGRARSGGPRGGGQAARAAQRRTAGDGRRGVSGRLEGSEGKGDTSNTDTGPRNGRVPPTPSRLSSSFAVKKDEADPGVDVATFSAASDPEPGGPRALGP